MKVGNKDLGYGIVLEAFCCRLKLMNRTDEVVDCINDISYMFEMSNNGIYNFR